MRADSAHTPVRARVILTKVITVFWEPVKDETEDGQTTSQEETEDGEDAETSSEEDSGEDSEECFKT